jgi:hypothetical protein
MYYIGYDLGSSFLKIALVNSDDGKKIDIIQEPSHEMEIICLNPGWAEQDPEFYRNKKNYQQKQYKFISNIRNRYFLSNAWSSFS